MTLRLLLALALLGPPLSAQCIADRVLAPEPSSGYGYQLELSGGWLAVGSRTDAAGTYSVHLHREQTDGSWPLAQTLTVPSDEFTSHSLALDGDRLFLSTGASIQGYRLVGDTWQAVGAPVTTVWSVLGLTYEEPYLIASNPFYDITFIYLNGRATIYRVEPDDSIQLVQQLGGSTFDGLLGASLSVSSDGSGFGTAVIAAPGDDFWTTEPGEVFVYELSPSGAVFLQSIADPTGTTSPDQFGAEVTVDGDLLAIHTPYFDRIEIYERGPSSSWTHDATLTPPPGQFDFGAQMELDGVNLVLSAVDASNGQTRLLLYQRLQGQWIPRTSFDEPEEADTDGGLSLDGVRVVGAAPDLQAGPVAAGGAWIWNLQGTGCPGLITSPPSASLASGAEIDLISSFAPLAGGELYAVLGSLSGTAPGVPLGALTVPLVPDAYTDLTLTGANAPPFDDTLGVLDGLGGASSRLTLPPGLDAGLAGLTLHHATLTLEAQTAAVVRVSAPGALTLVP